MSWAEDSQDGNKQRIGKILGNFFELIGLFHEKLARTQIMADSCLEKFT